MYLIVGLGNPSPEYDGTRHNLGRVAVSAWLAAQENFRPAQAPDTGAELWRGTANGQEGIVAPSLGGYMNESGRPMLAILQFFKIPVPNLILVHDELALPLSQLRLDHNISSAGHNGVQSVINAVGTQDFVRLRLGVESRADHTVPSEDFVLQKFSTEEETTVTTMVTRATETLDAIFTHGLDRAMTEYNRIVSG